MTSIKNRVSNLCKPKMVSDQKKKKTKNGEEDVDRLFRSGGSNLILSPYQYNAITTRDAREGHGFRDCGEYLDR